MNEDIAHCEKMLSSRDNRTMFRRVPGFRVRAVQHALATSLFVPLVAGALFVAQQVGLELPERRFVGSVLLALSAIPTTMHLLTAAAGKPWGELERGWNGLQAWERAISSTVALVCGLTAGAAVVLLVLSLATVSTDAEKIGPPPPSPKVVEGARGSSGPAD